MGEFVKQVEVKPAHTCRPPMKRDRYRPEPDANLGDIWRCDCGKHWKCKNQSYQSGHGSQRFVNRKYWVRKRPALWKRLFGVADVHK